MRLVYAAIQLINAEDVMLANKHIIGKEEIKQLQVNMLVDTGAFMMAINEDIQAQLQLPYKQKRKAQLAAGSVVEYDVVGPIEVRFKNRQATCNAFVLKGNAEPLLGAIPMEEMDVLVHPTRQELLVNPEHPYYAVLKMK